MPDMTWTERSCSDWRPEAQPLDLGCDVNYAAPAVERTRNLVVGDKFADAFWQAAFVEDEQAYSRGYLAAMRNALDCQHIGGTATGACVSLCKYTPRNAEPHVHVDGGVDLNDSKQAMLVSFRRRP